MNNLDIPIVVVAYDREHSLRRLLGSLDKCVYTEKVRLIICIDGGAPKEVVSLAEEYHWRHGEKEVICQEENIGLRAHILRCGHLALRFDGIVLLEDDLYVSPYFYQFMLAAQASYMDNPDISGVALYSPRYSETAALPFIPIEDGYDVFFMQLACSWGQSWLSQQWKDFECWYENNKNLILQDDDSLPPNVRLWPDTSWKKYFIKYNIENNKFFVYPRSSFSTNFADAGANHSGTKLWQVPLSLGLHSPRLPEFEESFAKYDAFCELLPGSFKKSVTALKNYDFTVDLYGVRDKETIHTEYVLSRNDISDHLFAYGCEVKPHELNIIDSIPGEHFKLGLTSNMQTHLSFLGHRYRIFTNYKETQHYFYSLTEEHYKEFAKDTLTAQKNSETAPQPAKTSKQNNPAGNPNSQAQINEVLEAQTFYAVSPDLADAQEEFRINAYQLTGSKNLLQVESSANGISYCWSGSDPEIQFMLLLNRHKAVNMQIRLVSLIKPEFTEQLKVFIDETHIQHSLRMDKNLFVVSCILPPSSDTDRTNIKIILPGTHRPMDLSASGDGRMLGIAINEIRIGNPVSKFTLLRERLRKKS